MTGCGIMSSVWDIILQWGSTIKVSIELPVATRHRRDMTEKLLKATLNQNTHTHFVSKNGLFMNSALKVLPNMKRFKM